MSRSGYSDDFDCEDSLAFGRWRNAVNRACRGKRGQRLLKELLIALDAMHEKRLYAGSFVTEDGAFCALGVLGAARGTYMGDLGSAGDCDPRKVGERFGIAYAMAAEIMYLNDEYLVDTHKRVYTIICGPMRHLEKHEKSYLKHNDGHPEERWQRMRDWVASEIVT